MQGSNAPGDHGWDDEESDEEKALEAELDAELERSADEDADAYTSTHEKRKEKFARQIGQLESQAMAETPWKMAGEVRPVLAHRECITLTAFGLFLFVF